MNTLERDALNSDRHAVASSGLPPLTGSSAEIQSAGPIRADMLLAANRQIAQFENRDDADQALVGARRLREITRASWWIACQTQGMETLLRDLSHRSCALESGGSL